MLVTDDPLKYNINQQFRVKSGIRTVVTGGWSGGRSALVTFDSAFEVHI